MRWTVSENVCLIAGSVFMGSALSAYKLGSILFDSAVDAVKRNWSEPTDSKQPPDQD